LDGTGESRGADGKHIMKRWNDVTDKDISAMLKAAEWSPANRQYFRAGGFSSRFLTRHEMPVTLVRLNLVEGLGPVLQLAEGWTLSLPEKVSDALWKRTDYTWPCTWFAPRLCHDCGCGEEICDCGCGQKKSECDCGGGCGCKDELYGCANCVCRNQAFDSVYSVMSDWGANHGAFTYGHIGRDLITLASMLRIPVSLHNVPDKDVFRPHSFAAFGTKDLEGADFRACKAYGPLYK